MILSGTIPERLQRAFTPTKRGIVGLTEQLLDACVGQELVFERVGDRCVCRWTDGPDTHETELPLSPVAFRPILARVAVLCNERIPDAVSPYGGEGKVLVGAVEMSVKFTNTTQSQRLAVKSPPQSEPPRQQ